MISSVTVTAPASIANLGPGFDVFALALHQPVDTVKASPAGELVISGIEGPGSEKISKDPSKNAVTLAAGRALEMMGKDLGLRAEIKKGIEPERGLGSSGASAVAGAMAANELYGGGLSETQLIEAAAFSEERIAGSLHYDNVTASTTGGFVIIGSFQPLRYTKLDPPPMKLVVASPEMGAPTKKGREILPKSVPLQKAVINIARASSIVAALKDGDLDMVGEHMIDSIVEPVRASKIPNFEGVKEAALKAGALGVAMSGAGPSVFAILDPESEAEGVKRAMKDAFERGGLGSEVFVTKPGLGATIKSAEG
ncbi:hypothetical protein AKJ45_03570 [candidate division MSBL1 archaeon SCGC-AAA261F19]|uniref:Homoserine kinase n=1 Tax=candidate division MSBL1 archaeon SCGC-AAA261F19 TaxID=1698275 RepID=A0A133V7B1_9EURY|nr:hypothetical protein AKJ45_03570 [candidate division MSBL1 archaeon SCGC-AAA261F19]